MAQLIALWHFALPANHSNLVLQKARSEASDRGRCTKDMQYSDSSAIARWHFALSAW